MSAVPTTSRGRARMLLAALGVAGSAFALAGCTADAAPPSAGGDAEPVSLPPTTATLDPVALGQACASAFQADADGIRDSDPGSASAAVRPDGLLFVTLPTQTRGLSEDGEVFLDADLYCYLDPDTLQPYVSRLGYHAIGVTQNLDTEYDLLFTVDEPIDGLLD